MSRAGRIAVAFALIAAGVAIGMHLGGSAQATPAAARPAPAIERGAPAPMIEVRPTVAAAVPCAAATELAAPPPPEIAPPSSPAAIDHAQAILDGALARGRWSLTDQAGLDAAMAQISEEEAQDLLTQLAAAVNHGDLVVTAQP